MIRKIKGLLIMLLLILCLNGSFVSSAAQLTGPPNSSEEDEKQESDGENEDSKEEDKNNNIEENDKITGNGEDGSHILEKNIDESENSQANINNENASRKEADIALEKDIDMQAENSRNVLPDGIYVIETSLSARQVIDVEYASILNGANVQIFESNASKAQYWQVSHDEKGYVLLKNLASGKVLDVQNGIASPGANVQQYELNNSRAQKWIAVSNEDGSISFKSALGKDLVLSIENDSAYNSSNVQIAYEDGRDRQRYKVHAVPEEVPKSERIIEDGTYVFSDNGYMLEVAANSLLRKRKDIANISNYFYVSYDENNKYYTIISCETGKKVGAEVGDVIPGDKIVLHDANNSENQCFWSVLENEDKSISLVNAGSGKKIGVDVNKEEVITVANNLESNLSWHISKVNFFWTEEEIDQYAKSVSENVVSLGTYQIVSSLRADMCLDVAAGSKNNGAKVQLYASNGTNAQCWKVEPLEDGYYRILNIGSGKVLDVEAASTLKGANVQQYEWNESRAQKWLPIEQEDGSYLFFSALGKGLVLDVAGGVAKNNTVIQTYVANGTKAQTFCLYNTKVNTEPQGKTIETGYYTITSNSSLSMAMDLQNANDKNGTPIQMYSINNTLAQCFWVEYCEDGYYRIQIAQTGKWIDLRSGGIIPGTTVQQWQNDPITLNQKWIIVQNSDQSYRIISAKNGLSIDCGEAVQGTLLTTQTISDAASQKWCFNQFKPSIAEGTYTISSALNSNKVIDIQNGTISAGGNAQIYSANKTFAQKWYVRTLENDAITLQNLGSGMYLTEVNNNVCQMDNSGTELSAQWMLEVDVGNGYVLVNCSSGKAIDLNAAITTNGNNIGTYTINGSKAQVWNFNTVDLIEPGFYEFAPLNNTSLRLDVNGGSMEDYANVQVYNSNGTLSQRWWVQGAGNGWYKIIACCSAKMLDVKDANTELGANVQQCWDTGSNAQKWKFAVGEKGIIVISALGNVLDVSGNSDSSGANVWTWEKNGSLGQQWRITSAATPGKIGWQNPPQYPQVSFRTVMLPSYCTGYFTYVTPSRISIDASRQDCINAFIARAYEYLGTKYIEPWSSWPGDAVDCSGLVLQCLYATGMDMGIYNPYNHRWLPGQTYNSMNWYNNNTFMPVSLNSLQRGDLIYYKGHVAIYIGGGQIIDSWPGQGVTIQGLYSRGNIIGAARPFV